jgi:uncharacterized membrane protein
MIDGSFVRAFDGLCYAALIAFCFLPLGIWKLVDIIIWVYQHVQITLK